MLNITADQLTPLLNSIVRLHVLDLPPILSEDVSHCVCGNCERFVMAQYLPPETASDSSSLIDDLGC
jgi:hypothetical protein